MTAQNAAGKRIAVVGGGAAGMMAAAQASAGGARVTLFEKNEKLGKKIYITGKGRCNLTNACAPEDFLTNVCSNSRFLYSAFYGFTNQDVMDFFSAAGCRLKTERGSRVFPVSDHASDVTAALQRILQQQGVLVLLGTKVKTLLTKNSREDRRICGLTTEDGRSFSFDCVILCTGGVSYPSTGSDGDGHRMAEALGHTLTPLAPSLVPMETQEADPKRMQGLSLKNVQVRFRQEKKVLYEDFGEMMFTHFGVTGPLILTASAKVGAQLARAPLTLEIDLKPAISARQLDDRLLRVFDGGKNKQIGNVLGEVYPRKLIPVLLERCLIPAEKPVHDISRAQRRALVEQTKCFALRTTALRGFSEAIVTRGGVQVKQVRPDTMESRLVQGLYFAGELLDVDALTGGFNLQIAWSTGCAAGRGAAALQQ